MFIDTWNEPHLLSVTDLWLRHSFPVSKRIGGWFGVWIRCGQQIESMESGQ